MFCVDYQTEIQPIFNSSCGNCHLGNSSGGLNLSNYNNLMSSGTVVAGDHMASILYDRITRPESAQGDMPPAGSLSQSDIDFLIPHQASGKGVKAYWKFGGFDKDKVMDIVSETGNCVAASLPLALVMAYEKKLIK